MRIFVTGGGGFVGSAVVQELVKAGHSVLGLARSNRSASALQRLGADVQRGALDDHETLKRAVRGTDAAIHAAFAIDLSSDNDQSRFVQSCREEQEAIQAMGAALMGTAKPLLVTAGVMGFEPGHVVTEEDVRAPASSEFPRAAEQTALQLAEQGVYASVVRLPVVHGLGDQGFMAAVARIAREKRSSAYVGEGRNRWPAVHRHDAAVVYRLAIEKKLRGVRLQAVAEEGVTVREVAEAVGRQLKLPVTNVCNGDVQRHFGDFAGYAGTDAPASSVATRKLLPWEPTEAGLLRDVEHPGYFDAAV